MDRYVAITAFAIVVLRGVNAPPPLRLTIDCGRDDRPNKLRSRNLISKQPSLSSFNVDSFCELIHSAIPKAVKDGKFILLEPEDQTTFADTQFPMAIEPPKGFAVPKVGIGMHKLRLPRVKVPKINVPTLRSMGPAGLLVPKPGLKPIQGPVIQVATFREADDEESSSERMEKFKKGVQKLFHVVKVLGQVDQYLSERARIVVEKLSKTLSE